MWVVPEISAEFIERMEDVLRVYARPYNAKFPVVCLDERPVVLRDSARVGSVARPGRVGRTDYEYVRKGTANDAFGEKKGRRLWSRFKVHYSPKHGSWLNAAEMEAGLVGRQCLGKRRIPNLAMLRREVRKWRRGASCAGMPIRWKFRVKDARRVFRYDTLRSPRSEH